jgi:DNA-directed RNA polymerase subunit N (RpoN/RPB10)
MIVPIRCFTCGKPITHESWEKYIEMTTKTDAVSIASLKEDYKNVTTRPFGHKADPVAAGAGAAAAPADVSLECMALNILKIQRMCCRRMYLGTIDIFDKL